MCSSLEVRITSDGFRLPELPGTQWPAYVWACQLLWYAHTLLYWQWNWSYFRIPKPVLSPTVVSSVKSNPENQTDLKQVLELVVRWKKYWFSKRALKLTEHCPLVPLGSQVFSALYRVNRDASCKRKLKEEKWSPLNWKVIILKPVMINKSRRYMWLMQRQINLINGTLFVLTKREHSYIRKVVVLISIVQPDVKREGEEDPNWRTDEHRKEDQHHLDECHSLHCLPLSIFLNLDCVGCPGQAPLPQFVQIGLNLWPKRKMTPIK